MVNKTSDISTPASLRRTHRGMVVALIQQTPGISRAEIARSLGFSEMASTRIVRELLEADLVEEIGLADKPDRAERKKIGRPKIGLRMREDGLSAAGITVSAYHSEVSVCDATGRIRARRQVDYLVSGDIEKTARAYGRELLSLIEETGIDANRIVGVGVALAARTSQDQSEILRSDYFGWGPDHGAFHDALRDELGLPIRIDNIANALAAGEMRFGVARGDEDFVLVHVATVIGAAIMSEGRLVRGHDGISGMIGHVRSDKAKHLCMCGRDDCLNVNATGFGILSRLGLVATDGFDPSHLQDYASALLDVAEREDMAGQLGTSGALLAPALDAVCKLLGPAKIVLSGYVGAHEAFLNGLHAAARRDFGAEWSGTVPIVAGEVAPNQAAALLALSSFCYSDQLDFERFAAVANTSRDLGKA